MTEPAKKLPRNAKVLGWSSFGNDLASEMIVPLLAVSLFTFNISKTAIGIIEGVADAVASLLKLFAGVWSDRLSKRKGLILTGYTIACLSRPLLALAGSWWHVFLIRVGDRFGKGIRTAPRDALLTDSSSPDQRGAVFGFHRAMDHAGAVVGPLLASAFLYFCPQEHRLLIFLTIVPGLCVIAIILFGLKETPRTVPPKETFRFSTKSLDRSFWIFLLAMGIFALGCSTDLFLLMRLRELGVPEVLLPLLWSLIHILKSIGNVLVGKWADKGNPKNYILAGWLWYAIIYLLMALIESPWIASILFVAYAFFYALTEPTEKKLISEMAPPEARGQAFGWYHFITGIMILPASALFGIFYEYGSAMLAFGFGAGCALMAAILLFLWKPIKR